MAFETINAPTQPGLHTPTSIDYTTQYTGLFDFIRVRSSVSRAYVNRGMRLDAQFNGARTITLRNLETVAYEAYKLGGNQRYPNSRDPNLDVQSFTLNKSCAFSVNFDDHNLVDVETQGLVKRWIARQTKERWIPTLDYSANSAISAHIVAQLSGGKNAYETSVSRSGLTSASLYHSVLDAEEEFMTRTEDTGMTPIFLFDEEIRTYLLKDNKFVRDNFKSQEKQIYRGEVGMISGMRAVYCPGLRMSTHSALIIMPDVVKQPVKIRKLRAFTPEDICGTRVVFAAYFGEVIARHAGMALHGLKLT